MSNSYEERKKARIDRYRERAEKAHEESNDLSRRAHNIVRHIPPGQPILVGHHSEKRHRRDLDRSWNTIGKSVAASEKAAYYEQKAEAAESNTAISSDDPEAIPKLEVRLAELLENHKYMVGFNKHYRKQGTCKGFQDVTDDEAARMDERIKNDYSWCQQPFPSYTLQNDNQNIKRIKDRIATLKTRQKAGYVGWAFDGGRVEPNTSDNRLQVCFDHIPTEEVRADLKSNGFRWSRHNKAWQRQLNGNAIYAAGRIEAIRPLSGIEPYKLQPKRNPQEKGPVR